MNFIRHVTRQKYFCLSVSLLMIGGSHKPNLFATRDSAYHLAELEKMAQDKRLPEDSIKGIEEYKKEGYRSLVVQTTAATAGVANIQFNPAATVYNPTTNIFYLGASDDGKMQGSLVSAQFQSSATSGSGSNAIVINPLAPPQVNINGAKDANGNITLTNNPLNNTTTSNGLKIVQLALAGNAPIIVPDFAPPALAPTGMNDIFLMQFPYSGLALLANTKPITDLLGNPVTNAFVKAAGTDDASTVFVAVAQAGSAGWNDSTGTGIGRGFATLQANATSGLNQAGNTQPLNIAATSDDKPAAIQVAFYANGTPTQIESAAVTGNTIDMYWDKTFQRLYIGLQGLARGGNDFKPNNALTGGVISVLVGTLNSTATPPTFSLSPIVLNPTATAFGNEVPATPQSIVGFNSSNAGDLFASALKVRTMHTSTGRDYLIMNGGVNGIPENINSWVYALPLVPVNNSAGKPNPATQVGLLAKPDAANAANPFVFFDTSVGGATVPTVVQSHTSLAFNPAAPPATLFNADEQAIVVGADPRFLGFDSTNPTNLTNPINDIQVINDSVYVSVSGDRTANPFQESGIFESSAIFDANGIIINWTPWQRVVTGAIQLNGAVPPLPTGQTDKVAGFGFNTQQASFIYLQQDTPTNIKATGWGTSSDVVNPATPAVGTIPAVPSTSRMLSDVLAPAFPNGITRLVNFDERTPGFSTDKNFSMMVAVGGDTVALIQTGGAGSLGTFPLTPTPVFSSTSATPNVFVFNDQALKDIAPLTSAELLRSKTLNKGYLFVGGMKGVACLQNVAGNGFNGSGAGLQKLDATVGQFPGVPGLATSYSFQPVVALNTPNAPFVMNLAADGTVLHVTTLQNGLLTTNDVTAVVAPGGGAGVGLASTVAPNNAISPFPYASDLLVINSATPLGVIATSAGVYSTSDFINLSTDFLKLDGNQPIQLAYLSPTKGGNADGGDLFVLTVNINNAQAKVYRFVLVASGAVGINNQFMPVPLTPATVPPTASTSLTPLVDFKTLRANFTTDGSILFNSLSRNIDNGDVLRFGMVDGVSNAGQSLTTAIDIDLKKQEFIAKPVRDTASGGWVVPGDWGVRVGE